tara:strand:- start:2181 stop:2429 length:249 start_codon:yes stop_codon:yes gene_type:complete
LSNNHLDILDAKMRQRDYQQNAPKQWYIEAEDQKGKLVDSRVDAHTLEIAKQMFLRQFPMHTIIKSRRIKSYIEKKGELNDI